MAFSIFFISAPHSTFAQNESTAIGKVDETQIIATDTEDSTTSEKSKVTSNLPVLERLTQQQETLLTAAPIKPIPVWLKANNQSVLGFWQQDLSGQPLGAVLLLHDEGETPITPAILLNLQQYLPQEGWASLSIALPSSLSPPIPKRLAPVQTANPESKNPNENTADSELDANENPKGSKKVDETQVVHDDSKEQTEKNIPAEGDTKSSRSKLTIEDIDRQAMSNIHAAIDYLHQQGQYNIVLIGEGLGGWRALQFCQEDNKTAPSKLKKKDQNITSTAVIDGSIRAVILLDVKNTLPGQSESLLDLLSSKDIPTFDVYTLVGEQYKKAATERKIVARKNHFNIYRQKRLPPVVNIDIGDSEARLTKTIRGFLDRFAKGTEL